jgi:hypothetical protein
LIKAKDHYSLLGNSGLGAATAQQIEYYYNHGDDQQKMDQTTPDVSDET